MGNLTEKSLTMDDVTAFDLQAFTEKTKVCKTLPDVICNLTESFCVWKYKMMHVVQNKGLECLDMENNICHTAQRLQ